MTATRPTPRQGPLVGLRVIDLGTMVAAPVAATMMGDFGAEVIKVEQPAGGDTLRGIGPFVDDESLWWQVEGRNKKSITLDLRQAEGQALLKRLVATADVLVENFRPGTLEAWGLGFRSLSEINPRLIMLSVSGFGQTGPYAARAGYDRIALAFSGVMGITGFPDRPPVRVGVSAADYSTATMGAFAIMMAVYHRDVGQGRGQHIDLALYESMFRFTDSMSLAYDRLGKLRTRTGNVHQAAAPGATYRTRDDRFLIMTISGDTLFKKLCLAMDRADMIDDPRYATHTTRFQHIEILNDIVADWILGNDFDAVAAALSRHGVPFSLVLSAADILDDEHYAARGNIADVAHPRLGKLRMQGVVPKMSGTPGGPIEPAHDIGQDTDDVLGDLLGLDADELARLRAARVL